MSNESNDPQNTIALVCASLLCRLWLGVRALQTGVEKWAGTKTSDEAVAIDGEPNEYGLTSETAEKVYGMEHYHGVPKPMYEKFSNEPLMMGWALDIYNLVLGPLLLVLGITILLGIANRLSLFALGLLYISLTWGLVLLGQQGAPGVAWLGTHMVLIVAGLALAKYNRFAVLKKW